MTPKTIIAIILFAYVLLCCMWQQWLLLRGTAYTLRLIQENAELKMQNNELTQNVEDLETIVPELQAENAATAEELAHAKDVEASLQTQLDEAKANEDDPAVIARLTAQVAAIKKIVKVAPTVDTPPVMAGDPPDAPPVA